MHFPKIIKSFGRAFSKARRVEGRSPSWVLRATPLTFFAPKGGLCPPFFANVVDKRNGEHSSVVICTHIHKLLTITLSKFKVVGIIFISARGKQLAKIFSFLSNFFVLITNLFSNLAFRETCGQHTAGFLLC